ncbi:MAG TPA: 2-hydroxy-3-oxopropionate reductase [Mycobacteriales bacterium]|nr:2-hydroxy-3-oxopropionate reductase [Mycobacteriales bacterium]
MSRIAFIGLGIMGGPMAANLVAAGHDVIGFNRSPQKTQTLVERGGTAAASIAEAVTGAEVIITMLPDSPDVEAVVLGENGVLSAAEPGALLIDMSTIEPQTARRVAAEGTALRVLDAPVSGGEQGAIEGTLSIMVGGAAEDLAAARPYLDVLGAAVVHVGPAGAGQTVKAANQLIVAGNLALIAEAIVFLEKSGLDAAAALEVIGAGLAGSTALARKGSGMLAREFAPGFRLDLHHKDLGIALAAARQNSVTLPVSALVGQLVAALCAQGHGGEDHSALLRIADELSGR